MINIFKRKPKVKEKTNRELEMEIYKIDPTNPMSGAALLLAKIDMAKERFIEINPDLNGLDISGYHYIDYKVEKNFVSINDYIPYELQYFTDKGYQILSIDNKKVVFSKKDE